MSTFTVTRPSGVSGQRNHTSSCRVPTASSTSVSAQRSNPAALENPSGWSSGTIPRPPRRDTTGACSVSASARTPSRACLAPLPTMIMGLRAPASAWAARVTASSSAPCARVGSSSTGGMDAFRVSTSHGMATTDGPGRPPVAWAKASATAPGTSAGSVTVVAHLVNEDTVACWSGISCRWPIPRPM